MLIVSNILLLISIVMLLYVSFNKKKIVLNLKKLHNDGKLQNYRNYTEKLKNKFYVSAKIVAVFVFLLSVLSLTKVEAVFNWNKLIIILIINLCSCICVVIAQKMTLKLIKRVEIL